MAGNTTTIHDVTVAKVATLADGSIRVTLDLTDWGFAKIDEG